MRAFTLLEMMLSIAIIGVVVAVGVPVYQSFTNRDDLSLAATTVAQTARRAVLLAQSGDGDSPWGVALQNGSVTVFRGATYASRNSVYDEVTSISPTITASGVTEFDFAKFTGAPAVSGNVTLASVDGEVRVVTVSSLGSVVVVANQPPVAVNDSISMIAPPESISFDPRTNDYDPDGDTLTIIAITQPSHGTATFTASSLTYTRSAGYTGTDSFTYTISDGHGFTSTATVSMTISAQISLTVSPSSGPAPLAVTFSGVAPAGRYTLAFGDGHQLVVTCDPPAGSTCSPANFSINYTYQTVGTYTATLTSGTQQATTQVTVGAANTPPTAVNDSVSFTRPQTSITFDPRTNDYDTDGDTLSIVAVGQPTNGTVSFTSTSVTYAVNGSYNGTDSFTYTISDGNGFTSTATVSVTINPGQTPPTAVNDFYDVVGPPYTITFDPKANDYDTDGDTLTIISVATPGHGTAVINNDNTITYTRTKSFLGDEIFNYTISDGFGNTATATIDISLSNSGSGCTKVICQTQ